jgi:hypothetical protein
MRADKSARNARRQRDPLAFDPRWAWREANRLALELRAGAMVMYPVPTDQRAKRLRRFEAVIGEVERIGLNFDVQLAVDGDDLAVLLVPLEDRRAA